MGTLKVPDLIEVDPRVAPLAAQGGDEGTGGAAAPTGGGDVDHVAGLRRDGELQVEPVVDVDVEFRQRRRRPGGGIRRNSRQRAGRSR